jgi:hypothetical protein
MTAIAARTDPEASAKIVFITYSAAAIGLYHASDCDAGAPTGERGSHNS